MQFPPPLVLAHKRLVVIFWVVITLVGMASASSATKALKQKFSVPGKEGWVVNQQIAHTMARPSWRRQNPKASAHLNEKL